MSIFSIVCVWVLVIVALLQWFVFDKFYESMAFMGAAAAVLIIEQLREIKAILESKK